MHVHASRLTLECRGITTTEDKGNVAVRSLAHANSSLELNTAASYPVERSPREGRTYRSGVLRA